jgi:pimeloyl-ACP methyl ester carboxylesterase
MPIVDLGAAEIEYRDTGGEGPPILFLHGALVDGSLWDPVVDLLPGRRCVVPTLPLGSHTIPARHRSALTPEGVADLIADLIERLYLEDVTVVANDTGGALAQLLVTRRPQHIARLVLTPCDALEVFPPALFKPLFALGRVPPLLAAGLQPLRIRPVRRLPIAFGWLSKRVTDETLDRWVRPVLADRRILQDGAHLVRHCDPRITLDLAPRLREFEGEVILAWAAEDRCFKVELGRRLAAQFRAATFVEISDSYTFVSIDRPDELARLL